MSKLLGDRRGCQRDARRVAIDAATRLVALDRIDATTRAFAYGRARCTATMGTSPKAGSNA
jgi:hypothetical protein